MAETVFTEKYNSIRNKLINTSVVAANGDCVFASTQWDTGATGTCVSKTVIGKLNLKPIGQQYIQTPSGSKVVNKYMVNIILNNEVIVKNLPVIETEIGNQGIDVLIGMDIIAHGDFAVSNYNGQTHFSFRMPSREHINFY